MESLLSVGWERPRRSGLRSQEGKSRFPGGDSHLSPASCEGFFPRELPLRPFLVYNLAVMTNHDTQRERHERLLELVKERVRRSGRSLRELEREMDLGHGTLGNIMRGRTELRFRHLEMIARTLGFDPAELLAEAYGQPLAAPAAHPWSVSREELAQILAEAVRTVLRSSYGFEEVEERGLSEAGG
jgi:transcriptional regulator with XRE-family HTH domain